MTKNGCGRTGAVVRTCAALLALGGVRAAGSELVVESPTFVRDVLPILQKHCQPCHRPGEVAPMSLMTYAEVRPWAKSIQKEVLARTMPPFHAEGPIGRFKDDFRLQPAQIKLIDRWVTNGAPAGKQKDGVKRSTGSARPGDARERDVVIEFEGIEVRSDGTDQQFIVYSEHTFPRDTWIRTIEYRPSSRAYVHHAGVFAVPATAMKPGVHVEPVTKGANLRLVKGRCLMNWLPGQFPLEYPRHQGVKIKRGERIALQIHFAPSTEAIIERSSVGLGFVDGLLKYETRVGVHQFLDLKIPPEDDHYELSHRHTLKLKDLTAQAFGCHMHLRGKACRINLHYPDGRVETVFEIPAYNFDWQRRYTLVEPLTIPKNTTIEYVLAWDNSARNKMNPDPTREVQWGPESTDEMGSVRIQYRERLTPPLRVKNGIVQGAYTPVFRLIRPTPQS